MYPILSLLLFLTLWYLIILIFQIPSFILPTPHAVVQSFLREFRPLITHAAVTAGEAVIGLFIACLTAFLTAIVMDRWQGVNHILYPLLVISQTIPTMVLAPLLTLWFGYGYLPKVLLVILASYFPIVIGFVDAMDQVDPDKISFLETLGASNWQVYRVLKIPEGMRGYFSGLKISASYCVGAAIVGEWISSQAGLGYYMIRAQNAYSIDTLFASLVWVVLLSLLFNGLARLIENIYFTAMLRKDVH